MLADCEIKKDFAFSRVAVQVAISLQSAEHVSKFCNLQIFIKATEHLQNWHAAPEKATWSHVPTEKTTSPIHVYKRTTSFRHTL